MMFLSYIKTNLLWTEGLVIACVLGALMVLSFFFMRSVFYLFLTLFIFSFYFFRNPERVCSQALEDSSVLICPADGQVVDVVYNHDQGIEGYAQKVSIFLSPFDVHVNWAPLSGSIEKITYKPGAFTFAFLPKSSELNERNDICIKDEQGRTIMVRQIAGTVARRICCWVKEHESITAGHKYGMIRFGSRVDIFLPANVLLAVGVGQRVYGGQTILGRWV